MRVRERRRDADLAQEALTAHCVEQRRVEHLERDAPAVSRVVREIDCRHAATSELALDVVPPGEGGPEPGGEARTPLAFPRGVLLRDMRDEGSDELRHRRREESTGTGRALASVEQLRRLLAEHGVRTARDIEIGGARVGREIECAIDHGLNVAPPR